MALNGGGDNNNNDLPRRARLQWHRGARAHFGPAQAVNANANANANQQQEVLPLMLPQRPPLRAALANIDDDEMMEEELLHRMWGGGRGGDAEMLRPDVLEDMVREDAVAMEDFLVE